jgi:hypothetical protein
MGLSKDEVLQQSKVAFEQWGEVWEKNCKANAKVFKDRGIPHQKLYFSGMGKTILCIAGGSSLEKQIETVKKYRKDNTDIICVDKVLGKLLDNGIKPTYVVICDAKISYEDYMEKWKDQTEGLTLLSNINANPKWAANWKGDVSFFVNKDNIRTEEIYSKISGCKDVIPAGSNVGNSVVIFAGHVLRYYKYLLLGYDFCWGDDDNYYAFGDNDKRYWMKHLSMTDSKGRFVNTSNNLYFSCRWLSDFYNKVILPSRCVMLDCGGQGIAMIPKSNLKHQLKGARVIQLSPQQKQDILKSKKKYIDINGNTGGDKKLNEVLNTYNVTNVRVEYLDKEDLVWTN